MKGGVILIFVFKVGTRSFRNRLNGDPGDPGGRGRRGRYDRRKLRPPRDVRGKGTTFRHEGLWVDRPKNEGNPEDEWSLHEETVRGERGEGTK